MLDILYEIQMLLAKEMPEKGTKTRKALKLVDQLIDELNSEE